MAMWGLWPPPWGRHPAPTTPSLSGTTHVDGGPGLTGLPVDKMVTLLTPLAEAVDVLHATCYALGFEP